MTRLTQVMVAILMLLFPALQVIAHGVGASAEARESTIHYQRASTGTRLFTWESETVPGTLKVLLDQSVLGGAGAEVAEVYFPPGWQGESHVHELEIFYVIEGVLEHVVNGEPYVLKPGMLGVVKAPDTVVHRTEGGAKALIVWPLGKEVDGLASVLTELPITALPMTDQVTQ